MRPKVLLPVLFLALGLAGLRADEPAQPKDKSSLADDLKVLASATGTTWELQRKGGKGPTVRIAFSTNEKGAAAGGEMVVSSRGNATDVDFSYELVQMNDKRYIKASGLAFKGQDEVLIPYRIKGAVLTLDEGAANVPDVGKVDLQGDWKRPKE